jgi:hypothetical protein
MTQLIQALQSGLQTRIVRFGWFELFATSLRGHAP